MKNIPAYVRDTYEVRDFLLEHRFKKAAETLETVFTPKQAAQVVSAGYGVQDEYLHHPGANRMTLFKQLRLERGLSHQGLAEQVTEAWRIEVARAYKEQCAQAKEKWLATLRPDQLSDARRNNIRPPEPKRLQVRRFEPIDIENLERGTLAREQTDPSWIQPFEFYFGQLWEDLVRPCHEGKRQAVVEKEEKSSGPESIFSIGAYKADVLLVVDVLLKRGQGDTARILLSLPDAIAQQIVGTTFSIHVHKAKYGTGGRFCLMRVRRLEMGLTCEQVAAEIEKHYRKHSSELFKKQQAEFIENWIQKRQSQLHPVEIRALRQGSMVPPGMPQRMVINPITGGDVSHMEMNRPHREQIGETVRPYEFFWNECWEDLMKLTPDPTVEKQEESAQTPAKVKASKSNGNGNVKAKETVKTGELAPSQAPAPSQPATAPPIAPLETATPPEVAANAT